MRAGQTFYRTCKPLSTLRVLLKMDLFTRSLYLRLVEEPRYADYAAVDGNLSNATAVKECSLAEKVNADKSIPGILGMNLAIWLVSFRVCSCLGPAVDGRVRHYALMSLCNHYNTDVYLRVATIYLNKFFSCSKWHSPLKCRYNYDYSARTLIRLHSAFSVYKLM